MRELAQSSVHPVAMRCYFGLRILLGLSKLSIRAGEDDEILPTLPHLFSDVPVCNCERN
ncbi:MAG: hypothetical protein ACI9BW_003690 [Gammaproteobacteria bacterium]